MGIWDKVKQTASDGMKKSKLRGIIREGNELTDEEKAELETLIGRTIEEDIAEKPGEYFHFTNTYGRIGVDQDKQLFKIGFNDTYFYSDLNTYELLENGGAITSGGLGVGRAIVGGALLGGVGLVMGGLTKKRKTTNVVESLKILVTFKNKKSVTIDFITKSQKKDAKYEKALIDAKETMSGFDFIMNTLEGEKHEEVITAVSTPSHPDSADELRKYKELLDDGIINQEEFDAKKSQILGI